LSFVSSNVTDQEGPDMETAPRTALRRPELVTEHEPTSVPEPARSLTVTVVYELSEAGRKASLLAGGDGRAVQQLQVQVPTSRLHLVTVDPKGVAKLKLRPRFELDAEHRVVRIDSVPTYDAPPSLEELFREAARNHELERAYQSERNAARAKRREAEYARRDEIAKAFLADKSQRALVHPVPSPKRCTIATTQGRVFFDVATEEGVSRDVPAEAHRRFRADQLARKEKNLRERAAQLALHEEKKRFIAEWIEEHGTLSQKERQAAGMLSIEDGIEAVTDATFAALGDWPLYARDGLLRLQTLLEKLGQLEEVAALRSSDVEVQSSVSSSATTEQWSQLLRCRQLLPTATVLLRTHRIAWLRRRSITVNANSVLVTDRFGPLTLRREYALGAESGGNT